MSRYQRTMRDALQSVADGQMEFDEAVKWEVKISGLPTFYADGKSKGEVKQMLRKMLKRPDDIVSITRTTPAELKMIRRGQIAGKEPGEEEEDVKEELLLELKDNRIIKVKNKELSNDDIVNMIQFGHPFNVVDEEIPAELPGPEVRRYKNVPNAVVDKEDEKANKAKRRAERDILIPTEIKSEDLDTWHSDPKKDRVTKHQAQRLPKKPQQKIPIKKPEKPDVFKRLGKVKKVDGKWTISDETLSNTWLEDSDWAQEKRKEKESSDRLLKIHKEREARYQMQQRKKGEADAKKTLKITPAGEKAFKKGDQKLSITPKGRAALEKDKRNQDKDPVGSQDEGIVSGAGKVAGAALGGAIGLGISPTLGALTGAGIIKKTSDIQKRLDQKKAQRKAEKERAKAAAEAEKEKKDPRLSKDIKAEYDPELKEVAPPGWGHTKADKPKGAKVGGSAHEFDKDLDSGKFKGLPGDKTYKDKKASMFKIMWSAHNKDDEPHYEPGKKDKLKPKYKKDENVLDSAKRYLDNG